VITELSLERVEFTCGHCWNQWSLDYDVQRYRDEAGRDWEYFYLDGVAVNSPYSTEGALRCPVCGRRWVGHIHARPSDRAGSFRHAASGGRRRRGAPPGAVWGTEAGRVRPLPAAQRRTTMPVTPPGTCAGPNDASAAHGG